jgi:hypothetical protein
MSPGSSSEISPFVAWHGETQRAIVRACGQRWKTLGTWRPVFCVISYTGRFGGGVFGRKATSKPAPFANGSKGYGTRKTYTVPPYGRVCHPPAESSGLWKIRMERPGPPAGYINRRKSECCRSKGRPDKEVGTQRARRYIIRGRTKAGNLAAKGSSKRLADSYDESSKLLADS